MHRLGWGERLKTLSSSSLLLSPQGGVKSAERTESPSVGMAGSGVMSLSSESLSEGHSLRVGERMLEPRLAQRQSERLLKFFYEASFGMSEIPLANCYL